LQDAKFYEKQNALLKKATMKQTFKKTPNKKKKNPVTVTPIHPPSNSSNDDGDDGDDGDDWPSFLNYPWNHSEGALHTTDKW
jgi:hypothetical protein